MHVLQVTRLSRPDIVERWAKFGIGTTYIPATGLLRELRDDACLQAQTVDAIALIADGRQHNDLKVADRFELTDAALLAHQLRDLPETVAMADGRKWSGIPIIVLGEPEDVGHRAGIFPLLKGSDAKDIDAVSLDSDTDFGADAVLKRITAYRQMVLSELDNLGFVVTYEAGRYRLGPALRAKDELLGHYYFGPADRRSDRIVTVDRDMIGIQLEIEQFEALINRRDVRERELQLFFEEHPHFLSVLAQPIPHVQLRDGTGKLLIPDLILKPLVASRRDSKWEVLELKLPAAKVTSGKRTRRRLSHEVWQAISQLREYGSYFADPRNEAQITVALGHALKRPKLAVLIGRGNADELEVIDMQQSYVPDVRIVTYDEILEQQKILVR